MFNFPLQKKGRGTLNPTALKICKKNRGTFGGARGLEVFYVIQIYPGRLASV